MRIKIKSVFIPLFLLVGIVVSQYAFDYYRVQHPRINPLVLPGRVIRFFDLGLHAAASSLLFVRAIQYTPLFPTNLPKLFDVVVDLDKKHSNPYALAVLILPGNNFLDEGIAIGERGVRDADPDWRIPYYLATVFHIFKNDRQNASLYFDKASRVPGVPEKIRYVALNYGSANLSIREQSKQIWGGIYETSEDAIIRKRAEAYIIHYEILDLLDNAVARYIQRYGRFPQLLDDLVEGRILRAIPRDPFGFTYDIGAEGRVFLRLPELQE